MSNLVTLPEHLHMHFSLLALFFIAPQLDYTRKFLEFVEENSFPCIQSLYHRAQDLVWNRRIIKLIEIF